MKNILIAFTFVLLFLFIAKIGGAGSEVNSFSDHGVAVPLSASRGIVASVDGAGRNVVVAWLFDHRGGYAILMIDARTGNTEQIPVPFPADSDGPYASLLSSRNKFYAHFNSHFVEFDVKKKAFTFWGKTSDYTAMSMTEDDNGIIWSVTYPHASIVAYNPVTRQLKDYGQVYKQNWNQYPRSIAVDDKGWIYFALGFTSSQIVAFNPSTGETRPMLADGERKKGMAYVYRDVDGKVYGRALEPEDNEWYCDGKISLEALKRETTGWHGLYEGVRVKISEHRINRPKEVITGNQNLIHRSLPDGKRIEELDLVRHQLVVKDPLRKDFRQEIYFEYSSDGANVMTVNTTTDGIIFGGTMFPCQFFSYDPITQQKVNRKSYSQWNAVLPHKEKVFVGGYPEGFLLEWDPSLPDQPNKNRADWNPRDLEAGTPIIYRPSKLLALLNGKTIVMGGTPAYGYTGGGLVFWDRETRKTQMLRDWEIIPDQSTNAMVALQGDMLLGGTTIKAGTGGEKKARAPELYLMDVNSKKVLWHQVLFPSLEEYTDLCPGPGGIVYGIVDMQHFFVFDPVNRKLIKHEDMGPRFGQTVWQQGPRVLIPGPDQYVYVLFKKGIARIDPKNHTMTWLADSPVPITAGGVYLSGRIYFVGGSSHLYSYGVE